MSELLGVQTLNEGSVLELNWRDGTTTRFHAVWLRDNALDGDGLWRWFGQLDELQNPVRRAFHLFTLLSAVRGHALIVARWEHVDVAGRRLRIPEPKGGAKRAYDVPLSRPMLRVLNEAKRAGAMLHPVQARTWIFPASGVRRCATWLVSPVSYTRSVSASAMCTGSMRDAPARSAIVRETLITRSTERAESE